MRRFSLPCLDPTQVGETEGLDLEEWTNDTEDIDNLRSMCVQYCNHVSPDSLGNCDKDQGKTWEIQNYEGKSVPDPLMLISDPEHLECEVKKSSVGPQPWKTSVIPPGSSPEWPSTGQKIVLSCGDYQTCAQEFVAPIETALYYNGADALWGPDMGSADYLLTTSPGSSSVTLTIKNPTTTSSSASVSVEDGRLEYSAPDCGETTCPFYLANLNLQSSTGAWSLYSDALMDDVSISDLTIQLRQPTLGAWNTSTQEFYVGAERIELWVTGTLQIGSGGWVEETYLVTNPTALRGQIGAQGEIEILGFSSEDSEFLIEAALDYDTVSGNPPVADHGLAATVLAPSSAGLPIPRILDKSWDLDGDIAERIWVVDGTERSENEVIPLGLHAIGLWVVDGRGALDLHESARPCPTYSKTR